MRQSDNLYKLCSFISDKCETATDFKYLSICLTHLNEFHTQEILQKYKLKVREMIDNGILTGKEHKTIVKILLMLNSSARRDESLDLIRKCSLLLENNINELGAAEIIILNEVRNI